MPPDNADTRGQQLALGALALAAGVVGVWATVDPASFYADFVLGRQWVALDGPYNEHLVRDVGALNLSLAVVTAAAARWPRPQLVRLVALATLVFALPHAGYHVRAMEPFGTGDVIAQLATLSVQVIVPLALLWRLPASANGQDAR